MTYRWVALPALAVLVAGCGGSSSPSSSNSSGTVGSGTGSVVLPAATDMTVTGGFQGHTTNGRADTGGIFCGPFKTDPTTGSWDLIAAMNGVDYGFSLMVSGYTGAASYKLGLDSPASFSFGKRRDIGGGAFQTDPEYYALSGTAVIDASQSSGSIDADIASGSALTVDSTAVGHIKGVWSCLGPGSR